MKAIAIEKLLKGLSDNWLNSIKDESLKEEVKEKFFITGGCIPSMLMDEFVSDFDVYFTDKEIGEKIRNYYSVLLIPKHEEEKSNDCIKFIYKEEVSKSSFLPLFISPQAITLTDKLQLVTKFYGSPEEVVKEFDWEHIKSYFKYPKLYINDATYRLINEKELIYTGSKYPLSSMLRTRKYLKKGWSISAVESLKIMLELAKYDLTNLEVLREQLMGVDPTYMLDILNRIENKEWEIDDLITQIENLK